MLPTPFDSNLQKLEASLPKLCRVRNSSTPVNRLPLELLQIIFELLMGSAEEAEAYQWRAIHSVCSYWRDIALRTPLLWSHVHIRKQYDYTAAEGIRLSNIIPISLRRSGSAPLRVTLEFQGACVEPSEMVDIVAASQRIRELHLLDVHPVTLRSFADEAPQLDFLTIWIADEEEDRDQVRPFNNWQSPRLRTLRMENYTGWKGASIRNLRHLIFLQHSLSEDLIGDLHTLLSLNSRLEDILLPHLGAGSMRMLQIVKALAPIRMPCLKRISTGGCDDAAFFIQEVLVLPDGHAKNYVARDYYTPIKNYHTFWRILEGSQKLYFGNGGLLIGTGGCTSFCVTTQLGLILKLYNVRSGTLPVREIWLGTHRQWMQDTPDNHDDLPDGLKLLGHVQKVILLSDIPFWLHCISYHGLFPSLTELQIHSRQLIHTIKLIILRFIEDRAQAGHPIELLHFVESTRFYPSEAFSTWQESPGEFESVVPRVEFEVVSGSASRMELPSICTTSSTAHEYWRPWDTYMD